MHSIAASGINQLFWDGLWVIPDIGDTASRQLQFDKILIHFCIALKTIGACY